MTMMFLKKDLRRNRIIHVSLFLFILLPALMIACGAGMILEIAGSLENLFTRARVPHFVQMHSGGIDQSAIDAWSRENPLVESQQTVEMLNIDGANVFLGSSGLSQAESVMDLGFVVQNSSFDLLLDRENSPIALSPGEIAVPLYFREQESLSLGDPVTIARGPFRRRFRIASFVRDAQMNPSIIHSKRFVLHKEDWDVLKASLGEPEYLIEFRLRDRNQVSEFRGLYEASPLPKAGPAVTYELFQVLNALSDSLTALIVILVSLLFCLVAMLCLRFTILASLEEDHKEIGVMKAIGIPPKRIRRIYLAKYAAMGGAASLLGWGLSFLLQDFFTANILLYMGGSGRSGGMRLLSFLPAALIFLILLLSCLTTLKRVNRISVAAALRGQKKETTRRKVSPALHRVRYLSPPFFLGLRDVFLRFRMFWVLGLVFVVSSFIILVPLNFLNTMQSPGFLRYLGIGRSDLRIDLRRSDDGGERFDDLIRSLEADGDIARFAPLITSRFNVKNPEGRFESISVESGDFSVFPLEYLEGRAPQGPGEIAFSLLNARKFNAVVGDTVSLQAGGEVRRIVLTGIYQDVTSGGYTAKTALPPEEDAILWYVVYLDLREGSDTSVGRKVREYGDLFSPARVTDTRRYLSQTLGNTIDRLRLTTRLIIGAAFLTALLITSLFLRMILAGDTLQIAIFRSLGFSAAHIRRQYLVSILTVLALGIVAGTIAANTMGQSLVSAAWSLMGASAIRFEINPVEAYGIFPLSLGVLVSLAARGILLSVETEGIAMMNAA